MFQVIKASEVYPKQTLKRDKEDLSVPFTPVPGEAVEYLGETRDGGGVIALSNYRLHLNCPQNYINIPLGLIEQVDSRDMFCIHILCKDARCFRVTFDNNTACEDWTRRILDAILPATKATDVFAFVHYAWASEEEFEELKQPRTPDVPVGFRSEISRLRFDLQGAWRICTANKESRLCPTYPDELLIPACISDSNLEKVAQFRSAKRIPAVVWRNATNGAVLARCSQPEVGWFNWRSSEDEELIKAIAEACAYDSGTEVMSGASSSATDPVNSINNGDVPSLKDLSAEAASHGQPKKVLIVDARSYAAAVGNRARGGGVECAEYYPNAEIHFMNLVNIHSIRKSFQSVRSLCTNPGDQTSWFQVLDATKWLHHMSGLLKAALRCATALEIEGRPVLVHCSDGWDRTPQIVALTELLLDPYYRTIEGFQVLVEREWLDFGHKMADRCGNAMGTNDLNERSPIFLQWLDCVHQLLLQFPCHFEFNLSFLVKLAHHTYSSLFGTFLFNSPQERRANRVKEQTRSVWSFLRNHTFKFSNLLYQRKDEVLWPRSDIKDLFLWKDVYVSDMRGGDSKSGYASDYGSGANNSRDGSENGDAKNGEIVELQLQQNGKDSPPPTKHFQHNGSNDKQQCDNTLPKETFEGTLNPIEGSTDTLVPEKNEDVSEEQTNGEDQKEVTNGESKSQETPQEESMVEDLKRSLERELQRLECPAVSTYFQDPLDSDGLVAHHNEIQRRLCDIFSAHRKEVANLRRDLYLTRIALCQNGQFDEASRESVPANDIEEATGAHSESTTSELSWEDVDDQPKKPTLWVPDHAANNCMKCNTAFWFGRRKHHCRNCGRLFCSECSENSAPIPTEQLYHPVRVCDGCFSDLVPDGVIGRGAPNCDEDDDEEDGAINGDSSETLVAK